MVKTIKKETPGLYNIYQWLKSRSDVFLPFFLLSFLCLCLTWCLEHIMGILYLKLNFYCLKNSMQQIMEESILINSKPWACIIILLNQTHLALYLQYTFKHENLTQAMLEFYIGKLKNILKKQKVRIRNVVKRILSLVFVNITISIVKNDYCKRL